MQARVRNLCPAVLTACQRQTCDAWSLSLSLSADAGAKKATCTTARRTTATITAWHCVSKTGTQPAGFRNCSVHAIGVQASRTKQVLGADEHVSMHKSCCRTGFVTQYRHQSCTADGKQVCLSHVWPFALCMNMCQGHAVGGQSF